jgi:zinc protease
MNLILRRLLILGFITSIGTSLTSCSSSPKALSEAETGGVQKQIVPLSGQFKVHRYILRNGLRLLVVEDHSSPTFAYQTWFKVGSRDESKGKTGLAHLFEHMMFKETKNMKEGEFDRLLEGAGAQGENAFTSRDFTAYIQELPKGNLDLIAKAESDRMVNLIINETAFKTERNVVQNERRYRNENSPDGLMDQELFGLAFQKHPYHWPVIGYQQDLDSMTSQDALEFYRSFYSPNHATVIVTGDVKAEEVLATVQKYYGNIPSSATPVQTITPEPVQTSPRRKQLKLNIQVEKLLMGYHIPSIQSDEMPILDIIQNVLAVGNSSRLYRALVDTGIATSVGAYDRDDKDPSLFVVLVNLQKGKKATQAETVILRELARLSKELVPADELDRAKNKLQFSFYQSLDSNFEKAYFLGHYETIAGDFEKGIQLQDKTQRVTPADIQSTMKRYFNPNNRIVITGVKK